MIHKLAGLLGLLCLVGFATAGQEPKDAKKVEFPTVLGEFESYKDEKLIIMVEGKKKDFKVPGETPVGYPAGEGKLKVVKAKDYLKDVKKGSIVSVTLSLDRKKVLAVGVTDPPKPKPEEDKSEPRP